MKLGTMTIGRRFRGPANSGNGGYVAGRVASYIPGIARVRLRVPPPLDVDLGVYARDEGVVVLENREGEDEPRLVAEGWPAELELDVPPSPGVARAEEASRHYLGFKSHRFSTCFVCGTDRHAPDGLEIYAGPLDRPDVPGMVASAWTPDVQFAADGVHVDPVYVWCSLDCPGGFAFPHPEEGTILLGELTVRIRRPLVAGEPHVIAGWEIERRGRKHFTGTAVYNAAGAWLGYGYGVWFEVPAF